MKFVPLALITSISLCAGLCCPGEDDYVYSNNEVRNDTIIQIENNTMNFQVDDTIYISTRLNNEQITINDKTVFLTDFISDTPESFYYYYLNLYKETAYGTYALIELNENALEIIEGETRVDNQSLFVSCELNDTIFSNKFGIRLLEPGTYYLSGSQNYFNLDTEIVWIYPNYSGNEGISIYSKIINSDSDGRYYFIVN